MEDNPILTKEQVIIGLLHNKITDWSTENDIKVYFSKRWKLANDIYDMLFRKDNHGKDN